MDGMIWQLAGFPSVRIPNTSQSDAETPAGRPLPVGPSMCFPAKADVRRSMHTRPPV